MEHGLSKMLAERPSRLLLEEQRCPLASQEAWVQAPPPCCNHEGPSVLCPMAAPLGIQVVLPCSTVTVGYDRPLRAG